MLLPPGTKPSGSLGLSFRPGDVPTGHTWHHHTPCLLHPFSSGLCLVTGALVIAAGMQHAENICQRDGRRNDSTQRAERVWEGGGLPHKVPSGLLKGRAAVFSPVGSSSTLPSRTDLKPRGEFPPGCKVLAMQPGVGTSGQVCLVRRNCRSSAAGSLVGKPLSSSRGAARCRESSGELRAPT